MWRKMIREALNEIKEMAIHRLPQNLSENETVRVSAHINQLFEHAVHGGKCRRSVLLMNSCDALSKRFKNFDMTPVASAAACIELMQASFLIHDDIMDDGKTRRGRTCWHKLPEIGLNAVNDGLLLDCLIPLILRNKRTPFSVKDAFDEARGATVIGQLLDSNTRGIEDCTWIRHKEIVQRKTSHYTFYTPIQIAALFTGQPFLLPKIRQIAYRLGYLFQCEDDFMDVFGSEEQMGKAGSDLREGKCTWITCKAVEKLQDKPTLLNEFKIHFGNPESSSDQKLHNILNELELNADFNEFRTNYIDDLLDDIDHFPMVDLRTVLRDSLNELNDPLLQDKSSSVDVD